MATIQTGRFNTVIRKARFVSKGGFSPQEMISIGEQLIDRGIVPRIQRGQTVDDIPAPPLSAPYEKVKKRKAPPAIRNWVYSGETLRSMKVITAAQNLCVIAFATRNANKRAFINNARYRQFGVSRSDSVILVNATGGLGPRVVAEEVPVNG